MNKLITFLFIFIFSVAHATEVGRIPVKETYLECQENTNATGAVVGGVAGYALGRTLFGKGGGSLLGAATGAVVGSQVQKPKTCYNAERIIGYRVMTQVDGKIVETYVPVGK